METKQSLNARVGKATWHKLRMLAALSDESLLDTLECLVTQEFDHLQKGGKNDVFMQEDQDRSE